MRRKQIYILIFAIAIIGAIFSFKGEEDLSTMRIEKKDIIQSIVATGRIEAVGRTELSFQKTGIISEIYFDEGEYIKKGDLLASLDGAEEELGVIEKKLAVDYAEINYERVSIEYKDALSNYSLKAEEVDNKKLNLERNEALFKIGGISIKELEDMKLEFSRLKNEEKILYNQYQRLSVEGVLRKKAILDIKKAENELRRAEFESEKNRMYSPIDGKILELFKEPYSLINKGEALASVSDKFSYVTANIDERDHEKLKIGQRALVIYQNRELGGRVYEIAPAIDRTNGTIEVKIKLDQDMELKTDHTVNIEIIAEERKNILALKEDYVFEDDEGKKYIVIDDDGRALIKTIQDYSKFDNVYLIEDEYLNNFLGKNAVNKVYANGQKLN